jgi:hypothetical protein
MRKPVLAISLVLTLTTTSAAQDTESQQARARVHSGIVKMWIGVALIGAGAVVIPVTAARSGGAHDGTIATLGFGAVAGGASLVWWGVHEQRTALASGASVVNTRTPTAAYVPLEPESETTLQVGQIAAVHFDPPRPFGIGSGGGSLVFVKRLIDKDGGTTHLYRADHVGRDTLVAAPADLQDGQCISCVTQHYFVRVVR